MAPTLLPPVPTPTPPPKPPPRAPTPPPPRFVPAPLQLRAAPLPVRAQLRPSVVDAPRGATSPQESIPGPTPKSGAPVPPTGPPPPRAAGLVAMAAALESALRPDNPVPPPKVPPPPALMAMMAAARGMARPPNLSLLAALPFALPLQMAGTQPGGMVPWGAVQLPPPKPVTPELPPGFLDQLKSQMKEAEGTSGKPCRFGRTCKSVDCTNVHAGGRDIEDDPMSVVCSFSRRCKRSNCFYVHPSGRELDEDPSKGMCRLGEACVNPGCVYTHPETRKTVPRVRCFFCGETGHIAKDCSRDPKSFKPHVEITGFPGDWARGGSDVLSKRVAEELEAFGELQATPEVCDNGAKVFARFLDPEIAKQACEALNGQVFDIEFHTTPPAGAGTNATGPGSSGRDKRCTIFVGNIPFDATEDRLN